MSSQSKELMSKMSDIVWSLRSPEEEKNSFLLKLKNYSQELLAGKGISANFAIDKALDIKMTNPLARKNLLLIAREAINNIAKYSGATDTFISFDQQWEEARLTIRDNGKGFDKTIVTQGNGLGNIEQRCRQLNGTCMIGSAPGKGVHITCSFPIAIISHTG
jgi:signal transduction histidine kinase